MTLVVAAPSETEPETEPHTEPAIAMEIGEIAGKLDAVLEAVGDVGECDHAEVLAQIAAVDAKLDAFIALQAAPVVELEPELPPEPVAETEIVTEPEPQPPEHPFFKKVLGEE